MAKVSVVYDTVAKTAECYMDGNPIKNLAMVDVYHSYETDADGNPKFALQIVTTSEDKDHKMTKQEYIRASVKQEEKPSAAKLIADMLFSSAK